MQTKQLFNRDLHLNGGFWLRLVWESEVTFYFSNIILVDLKKKKTKPAASEHRKGNSWTETSQNQKQKHKNELKTEVM